LIISAVKLLIQYAGRFIPEISYMCLRDSSRSLRMNATITHGIIAIAIVTMNEKSNAIVVFPLYFRTYRVG